VTTAAAKSQGEAASASAGFRGSVNLSQGMGMMKVATTKHRTSCSVAHPRGRGDRQGRGEV